MRGVSNQNDSMGYCICLGETLQNNGSLTVSVKYRHLVYLEQCNIV